MKKALAVLLLALMILQLAACSSPQPTTTQPTAAAKSTAPISTATKAPATSAAATDKPTEPPVNPQTWLTDEKVTLRYVLSEGTVSAVTAKPTNDLLVMQMYEELTNVHIEWETIPQAN